MRFLLALLLVACHVESESAPRGANPWPEIAIDRLPDDPRLGTRIFELDGVGSTAFFAPNAIVYLNDHVYVAITNGIRTRVLQIDNVASATPQVLELPDAPTPVWQNLDLGVALAANGCVLSGQSSTTGELAIEYWDGSAWTDISAPPVNPSFPKVIARSATEVLLETNLPRQGLAGPPFYYWNGTVWTAIDVVGQRNDVRVGPWGDAGFRVIVSRESGTKLCTAVYDTAAGTFDAEVCSDTYNSELTDGINGTIDDFFVGNGSGFYMRYQAGTWTTGDQVTGALMPSPRAGSTYSLLSSTGNPDVTPTITEIDNGTVGTTLLAPFSQTLACSCDRNVDAACPCSPAGLYTTLAVSTQHGQVAVLSTRLVDARERLYVRGFSLPVLESPLLPAWP